MKEHTLVIDIDHGENRMDTYKGESDSEMRLINRLLITIIRLIPGVELCNNYPKLLKTGDLNSSHLYLSKIMENDLNCG